ncbi:MAG TPA: hypothetical protein VEL03_08220, partial [Streptosporangiaceae bacterium]|nr:hypothetical protein [Streptosporangiaceae bacterium]
MASSPRATTLAQYQLAQAQLVKDHLAPRLLAALECVTVAGDCRSASVGSRRIEAASTAELTHRLSHAIYEVLHVGWQTQPADLLRTSKDEDFEARLLAATPHT